MDRSVIGAGAFVRLLRTAATVAAGTLTVAISVRLLGVDDYGILAFALAGMTLASAVGTSGIWHGAARDLAHMRALGDDAGFSHKARSAVHATRLATILGTVFLIGLVLLQPNDLSAEEQLVTAGGIALLLIGTNTIRASASIARGMGRVFAMEVPQLVMPLGRIGVLVGIAIIGGATVGKIATGYAFVGLVALLVGIFTMKRLVPDISLPDDSARPTVRSLVASFAPFAAIAAVITYSTRLPVLLLGFTGFTSQVGRFDATLRLVEQLLALVPSLFVVMYLPLAASFLAREDKEGFKELYVKVSKLIILLSLPAVIALLAFPEALLQVLYGPAFPIGGRLTWALLLGFTVNLAFGANVSALMATGERETMLRAAGVLFAISTLLSGVLVPYFGTAGAALAVTTGYVLLNGFVAVVLYRSTGAHLFRREMLLLMLVAAAACGLALLARKVIESPDAPEVITVSIGIWIISMVAALLVGVFRVSEFREFLPGTLKKAGS